MSSVAFSYATPSVFDSTRERALLSLTADARRPARFHARVQQHVLSLRLALQTLGGLIWSADDWDGAGSPWTLDPIVTVHPDRVFFEAFSADQSAYGLVVADRALFAPEGDVSCGTTNVDFTAWLWAALAEMRSSRSTWLRVGPEGLEVRTHGAGGRFEQKVEVPDDWVRGFLQLQGAMAMPGTRLTVRPVDLLAAVRHLRFLKAKVSPRALRWELLPGEDAALILEPWEQRVPLPGATHGATEKRVVRTWGRRRLRLLEPLLPYAESVDVFLKGRALPHFYAVRLPGVTFLLGLSGWTAQRWTEESSFDLLLPPGGDADTQARVLALLAERFCATTAEVASVLGLPEGRAGAALASLCAAGRCLYDVVARTWRHRELFLEPPPLSRLYPPDVRREEAEGFRARGEVELRSLAAREVRKRRNLATPEGTVTRELVLRDWVAQGRVGPQEAVECVLSDEDRLLFGRCGCAFFTENLLNRGPCAHLLALSQAARERRQEGPSSTAASPPPPPQPGDATDTEEEAESLDAEEEA